LPENIILLLVGINDKKMFAYETNIKCFSRTENQDELAELYSISEILLCLSYKESFGLTPVEAMSCGTPSIVYDNTALVELLTKDTGTIVKTGDVLMVLEAIKEILSQKKKTYSDYCVKRANKYYDKNKTYEKYIEEYNKLLKI